MLNFGMFQSPDLPYTPLPDIARKEVMYNVSKQGFTSLEHYDIFSLKKNQTVKANILAFAHPTHRTPEYTGLTVYNAVSIDDHGALISLLSRSASPFYILNHDGNFSLWTCPVYDRKPIPRLVETNIAYGQLDKVFSHYEVDLKPQTIFDVKQGRGTFTNFRDFQALQLSLWAADVNSASLVKHFGATVTLLRHLLSQRSDITEEMQEEVVTTLSIQLLGAVILADTGVLDDEMRLSRPSLTDLISSASERFGRYFKSELFSKYFTEANEAYKLLQQICYAGFLPDMLSELYATAYSEKERKESGSFDTPIYLTRHIWKNIPVEYLAPKDRIVADMTCGWGSFLVTGHERLSSLKDMGALPLRNYLYGNDNASFTAQLAGLGLLLATSEDSWNVEYNDALEWAWLKKQQPNIIVGNPPFGGNRKSNSATTSFSEEKSRRERANTFLKYAIERLAPGGYLAMIMPRSFTVAEASPDLRRRLLQICDVTELWELPSKVFSGPTQRTSVLYAQKKLDKNIRSAFPVRVRTLQSDTLNLFKSQGMMTVSEFTSTQEAWNASSRKSLGSKNAYLMDYKLTLAEKKWAEVKLHCVNLIDYANIMRGATVGKKNEKKRWSDYPYPKEVNWFDSVKHAMPVNRPWFLDYTQHGKIIYPNNLKEPCKSKNSSEDKEYILAGTKVLVPYASDPSWGKRIRVVIEREGYYVSDHFYIVSPRLIAKEMHITLEVVAAILNWDVSNAWLIDYMKSPAIPKRAMDTIPFPNNLSEKDCIDLTEAVKAIESVAYNGSFPAFQEISAEKKIDSILKQAYQLDDVTFNRLRQIKEWDRTPHITLDPRPNRDNSYCLISGIVDSIDGFTGIITLWLKGFDDLQTVPIAPSMPGWMLRPEASFRTELPYEYIKNGIIPTDHIAWETFTPQPYTYLKEEELFEGFASLLL